MKQKKNFICFAAGPLHLICIKEIMERNKSCEFIIYNFLYKKNIMVNQQMEGTSKLLKIYNIINIYFNQNKILSALSKLYLASKLYYKYKNTDTTFIIMDFRNTFMHFLRKIFFNSSFILIDDGFHTYINYQKYLKNRIYLPYFQYNNFIGKINKIIHFGFSFRKMIFKEFKLFTIYAKELNLPDKDFNNFSFITKLVSKKQINYSNSIVFFSGTKLVERGALTMDQELSIINKLKKYWSKRGKKLIYIAKRTSSIDKLNLIEKKIGVKVINFNLPLELALLTGQSAIPHSIISLGSTLNQTLPMMFDKIKSYHVDVKNMPKRKDLDEDLAYFKEIFLISDHKKNIINI